MAGVVQRRGGGAGRSDFRSDVATAPADRWRNYDFRDLPKKPLISKAVFFDGLTDGIVKRQNNLTRKIQSLQWLLTIEWE